MTTPEELAPQLRLDFYPGAILLTRYEGQRATCHPVDPHDLGQALSGAPVSSGLLPRGLLFWQLRAGRPRLGIYVGPRHWTVTVAAIGTLTIPLPGLVFVGHGTDYSVYAAHRRPDSAQARLFAPPCPNVFDDGRICAGNTVFPACTTETIHAALQLFLEGSAFNSHLSAGRCRDAENVLDLWQKLANRQRFPQSQLVPLPRVRVLRDVLEGRRDH